MEKLTDQRKYYGKKFLYQYALPNSVRVIKQIRLKRHHKYLIFRAFFSARLMKGAYIYICHFK